MATSCPTNWSTPSRPTSSAHIEQLAAGASQADAAGYSMLPGDAKLRAQYAEWLASLVGPGSFGKLRVLVDCANGAASSIAPMVFKDCDIDADFLHIDPNGRNINAGCGALHPEHVAAEVAKANGKYDLGITFDGDADRAMFSDAAGNVVNGDGVLLLAARDMKAHVLLHNDTVVATTMSNMGLEAALKRSGIRMLRAAVGDKYVLEEMIKTGATLGGEQSGHILFRDMDTTTGDGILTALRVMEVMARAGKPLAELVADMKVFPAAHREREGAREASHGAVAAGDGDDPRGGTRTRWQWPRRGALLRHGKAGARDGRSRVGRSHGAPREDDRQRAAEGNRSLAASFDFRVSRNWALRDFAPFIRAGSGARGQHTCC